MFAVGITCVTVMNVVQKNLLYHLIPSGEFLRLENSARDFLRFNFDLGNFIGFLGINF